MAKVRKPVSLLIYPSLDGPEMDKLREQGHTVWDMADWEQKMQLSGSGMCDAPIGIVEFNIILGPNCWWLPKEHIDLLSTALKAAQEERYKDQPKPTRRKKK